MLLPLAPWVVFISSWKANLRAGTGRGEVNSGPRPLMGGVYHNSENRHPPVMLETKTRIYYGLMCQPMTTSFINLVMHPAGGYECAPREVSK